MRERIDLAFHIMDREYGVTRLLDPEGKISKFLYYKSRKTKVVYPDSQIWLGWPSCVGRDGWGLPRCLNCNSVICQCFYSDCSYRLLILYTLRGKQIISKDMGFGLIEHQTFHQDVPAVCSKPRCEVVRPDSMPLTDHCFIRRYRNTWGTFRPIDGSLLSEI